MVDSHEVIWENGFDTIDSGTKHYIITGLESGVDYRIIVTAVNGAGRSTASVMTTTMKSGIHNIIILCKCLHACIT